MLTLAGIGVWWLVFFNRSKVKEQFGQLSFVPVSGSPLQAGKRPLSIAIIAWFLLIGCVFIPFTLMLRFPAVLFTKLLTGWPAVLFYLSFAVAQLCIGVGLLRIKPAARIAAIFYLVFGSMNALVFNLAPGGHARMLALMESERAIFPWMRTFPNQPEFQFDWTPFMVMGAVCGLIGAAIPLYFLITRKVAYENAAARLESGAGQA